MLKHKQTRAVMITLVAAVTGLYAAAVMMRSAVLSGIASPLGALLDGVILFAAYLEIKKNRETVLLLLIAVSCVSWAFGDLILVALRVQGRGEAGNVLTSWAYFVPNLLFAAVTILFGYIKFDKWKSLKGIIETVTIGVLSTVFIWSVLFNRDTSALKLVMSDGLISAFSIIIDFFICIEFFIMFFSDNKSKIPLNIFFFITGVFLYAANDIVYYVTVYKNIYSVNNLSDFIYIVAFALTAIGALLIRPDNQNGYVRQKPAGGRWNSKWPYLLVFPVISFVAGGAEIVDLLIYAVIIGLYHASMKYIQLAKENEELYKSQFKISENLEKRLEEQLAEMTALANRDTITKLYNRRYFSNYLQEAIRALKSCEKLSVILFDVDRFKTINDSYGHNVGDEVIAEISQRLLEWNTHNAVLARLGGDEFAILLTGGYTEAVLGEFCRQIIDICSMPIFVDNRVVYVTISIGISMSPDDAKDSVTLLKNADISMYKAKAEGFNKFVFYSPLFKEKITQKNEIEALLRKADLATDFELVFQPQFDLPEEHLIGAEALIRWKTAEHGYIPPSVFVPVAEEIDFISKIGRWVLIKAVEQVVNWNTRYGMHLKMGINISPKQLSEDDFFMTLKSIITENNVNTAWIDAEITENLMIEEKTKVKPIFDLFEELKISVSIDDFGSGYSSLGYLNKYHFDRIKIDKSLIDNLLMPGGSGIEIVKAIINLAEAVGKTTIAEGVETREQLKVLNELGCRQVQGYLLGKPVTAETFVRNYIVRNTKAADDKAKGHKGKTLNAEA